MNSKERLFWIAGIILVVLFAQQKSHKADNLQTLITTYQLESNIQDAQITDIAQQVRGAAQLEYDKGFEAGRTQAAIVLMDKGSLYNYTDGYHAAVSQFGVANPDGKGLSQDILLDMLLSSLENEVDADATYLNIITDMISNKEENDNGSPR